jgi:hypothetical protein
MGENCQLHVLATLMCAERNKGTHCINDWMGHRIDLDAVVKRNIIASANACAKIETSILYLVRSHFTVLI